MFKRLACAVLAVALAAPAAFAQDPGRIAADILHQRLPGDRGDLTRADAIAGLREVLSVAADTASTRLGAPDGYFADAKVRIPLPGALGDAQRRLKPFGMSAPLDDLQLRVNRAAEASAPAAGRLMLEAVKAMTIDDAMGVLRGGDTAATDFLRARTGAGLKQAVRPYFEEALDGAGAFAALDGAVARYGAGRLSTDTKTWLLDHAVAGALDGLFYYVGLEEQAIRRNPVKRTSELLRRVFGG